MIDSAEQIRRYEELFKKKNYKVADILYQAWLLFKWDAIGNQQEAFDHVLKKRKPANLQAKKKREKAAPPGSAKYHMNDVRWNPIFEERMEKEAKTKKKATNSSCNSKQGRSRSVAPSTVTSGALESNSSVSGLQLPVPVSEDNNSNIESRSASSTVTSEAVDSDSELPDIPESPLSNSLLVATSQANTEKRKRKRGINNNNNSSNITRNKRAKQRPNGEEVRGKVTSSSSAVVASVPKFPLENGLVPFINDDDDTATDETSCDITKTVVQKKKAVTFLDIDFDLDVSTEEQSVPINETVNSNSNSKSDGKSTRASGRLSSRGKSELSLAKVTSKLTSTASPAHDNNNSKGKMRSKGNSAASQSTVPMTVIDDGEEIIDQKANEISVKKKRSKRKLN